MQLPRREEEETPCVKGGYGRLREWERSPENGGVPVQEGPLWSRPSELRTFKPGPHRGGGLSSGKMEGSQPQGRATRWATVSSETW